MVVTRRKPKRPYVQRGGSPSVRQPPAGSSLQSAEGATCCTSNAAVQRARRYPSRLERPGNAPARNEGVRAGRRSGPWNNRKSYTSSDRRWQVATVDRMLHTSRELAHSNDKCRFCSADTLRTPHSLVVNHNVSNGWVRRAIAGRVGRLPVGTRAVHRWSERWMSKRPRVHAQRLR